jgi:hypothetical protein
MIEYFLNTGVRFSKLNYHNIGQVFNGIGVIDNSDIFSNDISINGQMLLETSPDVSVVAQSEIISNSGEFFLSGNLLRNTTGYLDLNFQKTELRFDKRNYFESDFYRSSSHTELISGFAERAEILSGNYVFLNGVKLTSGENYIENSTGWFEWIDSDISVTGVLFSMPRNIVFGETGYYDLLDISYNKGATIGFLNGVKLDELDVLETASIVSEIIHTGLEPFVSFGIKPDSENILL